MILSIVIIHCITWLLKSKCLASLSLVFSDYSCLDSLEKQLSPENFLVFQLTVLILLAGSTFTDLITLH